MLDLFIALLTGYWLTRRRRRRRLTDQLRLAALINAEMVEAVRAAERVRAEATRPGSIWTRGFR